MIKNKELKNRVKATFIHIKMYPTFPAILKRYHYSKTESNSKSHIYTRKSLDRLLTPIIAHM